jgi:deoxyguanosine kinase
VRPWRHIAIEGPIGAGKTSLARALAPRLGAELLLERPEDNPFLARYYAEGARHALPTQLTFLFQRIEQYRALAQPGMFGGAIVSDFMFDKDALFAELTLADDELRLYGQLHAELAPRVPAPDLVLWLQADLGTLMARIAQRGIAMEQAIAPAYVQQLADAYGSYFARHPALPVLAIDAARFNPFERPADLQRLLARLETFRGPREALDVA